MNKIDEYLKMFDTQDYVCSISPEEFEAFCMDRLKDYANANSLENFEISHNIKMQAPDGIYQIDVFASFTALGVNFKVLCECKQYKAKVKRETVQILADKIRNLGMQKGILLSTSGFQKGAIEYAKAHGIALIQVYDTSCIPISHSAGPNAITDEEDPFTYAEKHWPIYKAICLTSDTERPQKIYPTRAMVDEIHKEIRRLIKKL